MDVPTKEGSADVSRDIMMNRMPYSQPRGLDLPFTSREPSSFLSGWRKPWCSLTNDRDGKNETAHAPSFFLHLVLAPLRDSSCSFILLNQSPLQTSRNIIQTSLRIGFEQLQFYSNLTPEMIPSPRILLLCMTQSSFGFANIINTNALNFQQQNSPEVTMRPPLKLRNPTSSESTMTSPAQLLQQNSACLVVGEALATCISLSSGFTTLQPPTQAHCLCYSSTSWLPKIFDDAVESCADYASTVVPSAYQLLVDLEGFCESVGDVETPPTVSPLTTLVVSTVSAFSGQPCNSLNSFLNHCSSLTPEFSNLQPSDQAKCLCYVSSTSWCPTAFDNAVGTCASFAQTAEPSVFAIMSGLGGFCAGVGDILATTTASYFVATTLSAVASVTPNPGATSTMGAQSGTGGVDSTAETGITVTIGGAGARNTGTANSGAAKLEKAREGEVIAISLICAFMIVFL